MKRTAVPEYDRTTSPQARAITAGIIATARRAAEQRGPLELCPRCGLWMRLECRCRLERA